MNAQSLRRESLARAGGSDFATIRLAFFTSYFKGAMSGRSVSCPFIFYIELKKY